jgi:6-phosphogluconolactonase (cycloisomerase 2 family)
MLGAGRMVTADMGHDLLRFWSFAAGEGGLQPEGVLTLPHGSGPRHFARGASGLVYVNTEYSGEVAVLRPVGEWLEPVGLFPVSAAGMKPGDAAAEICLDPAERHLYVGVRGSDRICRMALDADGIPTPLDEFPCGGEWPRHHCFDGDRLIVALERSDAVAAFEPGDAGHQGERPQLLATGSPTCVLAQR